MKNENPDSSVMKHRQFFGKEVDVISCASFRAVMAIENARDVYTRRQEGVSIWVVESKFITASNPEEAGELYEPAIDKVYRHPTFYELPDEVGHM